MKHPVAAILAACLLVGAAKAQPAATEPVPGTDPATAPAAEVEGAITAVITGVEGNVAVRISGQTAWKPAAVGMQLNEGDEIRTNFKSAVRFVIPPDQTITIDRLSTIQLSRANFKDGKFNTDLIMKYGRVRYDIESAGREHDAKVRSPSSVLAIRGTKVSIYDQPPFAPEARSLTGRAMFRDVRKQVAIGSRGGGKARVTADSDSPAQTALAETVVQSRGGARTNNENQLGLTLAYFQQPENQVGVFEIFGQAQNQAILNSLTVIGTIAGVQPSFEMGYSGSPLADVDFVITGPTGDVVDVNNFISGLRSATGGNYSSNDVADSAGQNGFDLVVFDDAVNVAPKGVYTVQTVLKNGTQANTTIFVLTDKLSSNPGTFGPITQTLTSGAPSQSFQVNLLDPPARKRKR